MFIFYLLTTLFLLIEEYIRLSVGGNYNSILPEFVLVIIYLTSSVVYLIKYRKNNLFCFETIFLFFGFLITFFDYLVLSATPDSGLIGSLFELYSDDVRIKTLFVSMLAMHIFMLGCYISDKKCVSTDISNTLPKLSSKCNVQDLKFASTLLTAATLGYFMYLYSTGYVATWFRYGNDSSDYTNTKVVYLTVLCLSSTVAQFTQYIGQTFSSLRDLFKRINKFYVIVIGTITFLLLISGNRSEALYVIMPMIACYSILVKPITNRQFLILFFIGFLLMVFIGLTRQVGVGNGLDLELGISLFDMTRDFGYANIDSMYLIQDTDLHGAKGFNMGIISLLSTIPFVGGVLVSLFGIEEFTRSAIATTEGMNITYTGLGTSLVGDTYYTGGIIFVLAYFFLLGFLMSYLHSQFYFRKVINVYTLVIYAFMFSNAIYCLRSEWYTSFRYIGFSIVLLFICFILKKGKA